MKVSTIRNFLFIAVSVALVFLYVRPTYSEINEKQSELEGLKAELGKIEDYGNNIDSIYNEIRQKENILTIARAFLPKGFDSAQVGRDLLHKAGNIHDLTVVSIATTEDETQATNQSLAEEINDDPAANLISHKININLSGSYEQFKDFLSDIEKNRYPLYVRQLNLSNNSGEGATNEFIFGLVLETFSQASMSLN